MVVNQTAEHNITVRIWSNAVTNSFEVMPGETVIREVAIDEYRWSVYGHDCFRDLPQLFVKDTDDAILIIVPTGQEGGSNCPWALQVHLPE